MMSAMALFSSVILQRPLQETVRPFSSRMTKYPEINDPRLQSRVRARYDTDIAALEPTQHEQPPKTRNIND
jgi:hypothetical protein